MTIFYVNGAYLPEAEASLPVRDLSVLRGYGAFDFLRTYGGKPFRLPLNVARLRRSCQLIELDIPWSDQEIVAIVEETLRRNAGFASEFNIRLVITGGVSSDNITPDGEPSLLVLVQPLREPPRWWYDDGVKVITVELERLIPDAKSIIYTPAILAQKRARQQDAIEALYRTEDQRVLEGTTTNLFAFFGSTLVTPPLAGHILSGVTRMTLLELAEPHFVLEIRDIHYDELLQADEVFMTAANKQVVPIVQVDDAIISDGRPGAGTRQLMQLFHEMTLRRAAGIEV
jgi:branched-chain amino acid aminotransferase